MEWTVTSGALATVLAECARAAPLEACGLLLGRGTRIDKALPSANVAADPAIRFEIDPHALVAAHRAARAGGPQVLGYFHSHPTGSTAPSPCDRTLAAGDGRVWAIVAAGKVGWWRDIGGTFAEITVQIAQ